MEEQIFLKSEQFWTFAQNSLRCNPQDGQAVNAQLVRFLKTVADHIHIFVNEDQDLYRSALSLVSCDMYEQNKHFCIAKQLSLLRTGLPESLTLVVSYVLLLDCKNDVTLLEVIQDYQGFTVIYNSLHSNFQTLALVDRESGLLNKTCTVQLDILFQMCKYLSIEYEELARVDTFFVNYIFESLVVADVDDVFNAAKFKLILAMNEQFMIASRDHPELHNKVIETIAAHQTSRNFSECLLMFFNREEDRVLQIMIAKILYLIFTGDCADLFYHNDLNVLVDVLIRELADIGDEEQATRNTFLRVLHPLLARPQFEVSHYKRAELTSLLKYHAGISQTFWTPSETTKRLALRCLNVSWLKEPETALKLPHRLNVSDTSLNSISKKRPPPPPPLPRKGSHFR